MRHRSTFWQTVWLAAWFVVITFYGLFGAAALGMNAGRALAYDGCYQIEMHPHWSPTGIAGCVVYGDGVASHWQGPGVARNDCVYPWTDCQPVRITSHETEQSVVVTPTMFCDCFTGTPDGRIVDLDPVTLRELGLDPAKGLYPVTVEPVGGEYGSPPALLPDTALR